MPPWHKSLFSHNPVRGLYIYLEALEPAPTDAAADASKLFKIGELAKATGESVPTLRFWTQSQLLQVAGQTPGGYQLFSPTMIPRVQLIRKLQQEQRLTLEEIRQRL